MQTLRINKHFILNVLYFYCKLSFIKYFLVPEEIFTQDSKAQTSFDSYNPKSQTENIDLTLNNEIDNQKLKVRIQIFRESNSLNSF